MTAQPNSGSGDTAHNAMFINWREWETRLICAVENLVPDRLRRRVQGCTGEWTSFLVQAYITIVRDQAFGPSSQASSYDHQAFIIQQNAFLVYHCVDRIARRTCCDRSTSCSSHHPRP